MPSVTLPVPPQFWQRTPSRRPEPRHWGQTFWPVPGVPGSASSPGFGPAGRIGIPGSGLYLVVAASRESPHARRILATLIDHIRFGRDDIGDFVRAVRPAV